MLQLFYIIIFLEIFTILYNILKFVKILTKKNKSDIQLYNEDLQINILIPCYKEVNIIKETLEHFNKITKNMKNINIYVITTDKEKYENSLKETTYEYLMKLDIIKCVNIHIINYPKKSGFMADQLNHGIDKILSASNLTHNKIYFSIYNADSLPDTSTFSELISKILKYNYPKVLQQYSNYYLNYNKQNFIMKGFAMYQTAFELRNGLINNKLSKLLYSHVVGHGLTIRADYITKINGFSSNVWCEDIYLTGLLFNNGIDIIPLTSMDNSENPEKLSVQINQNAVWFKTASHPFKSLKDIKKDYKITKYGIIWLFHELRATFVWIFMPIFLIYSFIYPVVMLNLKLLILAICSYFIFCFVNYTLNLIIVSKERFKIYLKDYFALIFSIMFTGIGPIRSFFLKEKIKTPR